MRISASCFYHKAIKIIDLSAYLMAPPSLRDSEHICLHTVHPLDALASPRTNLGVAVSLELPVRPDGQLTPE